MLTAYIRAAMSKARYEILPNDGTYYGETPGDFGDALPDRIPRARVQSVAWAISSALATKARACSSSCRSSSGSNLTKSS